MHYVNLGRSGLKVSRICLGTMSYGDPAWRAWVLDETTSRPFIARALELGINFFDTANMYSLGMSEEIVGRALRDMAQRDEVVIATKVYFPMGSAPNQSGLSRKHIFAAIDASLTRLGTDYVDLLQIHRFDPDTPIEETLDALNDVVTAGKARYIGASTMYAWQFAKMLYAADKHGWRRFISMQNHYNLIYREEEREMLALCAEEGIGVIPWSPLARGVLAQRRERGNHGDTLRATTDTIAHKLYYQDNDYAVAERLFSLAERRELPAAQLALAWLLHQPTVTAPIIGATKLHHLDDAVAALDVTLDAAELTDLEALYQPHPVTGVVPVRT